MSFKVALVSTGGTIEKTYDELSGVLGNTVSVLDIMLSRLSLPGLTLHRIALMNKDSLDMTDDDHTNIAQTVVKCAKNHDGVVVIHGTDRLAKTGERLYNEMGRLETPVVLTGAMRPYVMRTSDALQNLTEALLAAQLLPRGVYVAMHNTVLQFPGVAKDSSLGRFVKIESP